MSRLAVTALLLFGICVSASADIWMWTNAKGEVHMVNSSKPIYTWVDETGKVHYSDTPDHEDAVSVELVWHSTGNLESAEDETSVPASAGNDAIPGETEADRVAREQAEAHYCKQAKDIYDSYLNAPRLYEIDADGERVYLNKKQMAAKLVETEAVVAELCN